MSEAKMREALFHTIAFIEASLAGARGPNVDGGGSMTFTPGVSDLQLTPDGSYKLSQARAALGVSNSQRSEERR
jgi:hypothetical protein